MERNGLLPIDKENDVTDEWIRPRRYEAIMISVALGVRIDTGDAAMIRRDYFSDQSENALRTARLQRKEQMLREEKKRREL